MTIEEMEKLRGKYPYLGALTLASDGTSFTVWCHDGEGNQLKITAKAGSTIKYEEVKKPEIQEKEG
jgi:hypothetical protein